MIFRKSTATYSPVPDYCMTAIKEQRDKCHNINPPDKGYGLV